jgi:D-psicose/D-tagatose/L-ribulose 3-epimerase
MTKFGAHAFLRIGEWTTESGNHAIEQATKEGFDYIEIPLLKPEVFNARSHQETLKKSGISATTSLTLPKGYHMPDHPKEAFE